MHILLIHQAFVGPNEPGGTRHFEFAKYIGEQGHKFTIIASDTSYLTGKRNQTGSQQNTGPLTGVEIIRVKSYSALHKSYIHRIIAFFHFSLASTWLAMKVKNVDLVIGTSPPIFQAISAWLVSFLKRKPFILEVRDLWPEFAIDIGLLKNKTVIYIARKIEQFLYKKAKHVIVNSPAYKDYLITKNIQANKISLVSNGVDPEMFNPENEGLFFKDKFCLDGSFVVTYTGALGLANDIDTIISASKILASTKEIKFLLVGDGKEKERLEQQAGELELENVIFTGTLSKEEIPSIIAASDVCVATLKNIPMFTTTYPNKVFDYMAAAKPTILAIDGVIRSVIENADGGMFVTPGDEKELSDAVQYFYNNPNICKSKGANARKYVVEHFDRKIQAQEFLSVLIKENPA